MNQCTVCKNDENAVKLVAVCTYCSRPICETCDNDGTAPRYKRFKKDEYHSYCSIDCVLEDVDWSPGSSGFPVKLTEFASPETRKAHKERIQEILREHDVEMKLKKRFW